MMRRPSGGNSDCGFGLAAEPNEPQRGLITRFEASSQTEIMSQLAEDTTNPTLLGRLSQVPNDPHAWSQFVDRYGPRIRDWCRRWGLQEADSHDVQQSVLLRLVGVMQTFQYDRSKSFRAWLKTLAQHAWSDLVRNRKFPALGGDAGDNLLESIAARDDLADEVERTYERELLDLAMQRVQLRVLPETWQAFVLTAVEGLGADEVSGRLAMRLTSVYKARSNVQKLIQEEVAYLEGADHER